MTRVSGWRSRQNFHVVCTEGTISSGVPSSWPMTALPWSCDHTELVSRSTMRRLLLRSPSAKSNVSSLSAALRAYTTPDPVSGHQVGASAVVPTRSSTTSDTAR
jgi:hypothetical protein